MEIIPLVAFPELVEHYAPFFADVFSTEALIEFKRYISGLLISESKTVEGINRLCVCESRNQSSLNRLLIQSPFSLAGLDERRLAPLDSVPATQMKCSGVMSLDDTLLTHYGQHFEKIAYLWDHVQQRYTWAHSLVSLHYSDNETDYPLNYQLWEPPDLEILEAGLEAAAVKLKASKYALKENAPEKWRRYLLGVWRRHQSQPEVAQLYSGKLRIAERLLAEWLRQHPDLCLPVTFDNWCSQPGFCHFLNDKLQLTYVGTLAPSDQLTLKTGLETLEDFAARLKQEHQGHVATGRQYSNRSASCTKDSGSTITAIVLPIRCGTLANTAWSSITRTWTCQTRRCSCCRIASIGKPQVSHVSVVAAGPLKCIMKRARPKGWTSINYGILWLFSGMSL